jgi:hypothetical protein
MQVPLHDCKMSMPMTCLMNKKQDTLFHALYCSDIHYLKQLIEQSVIQLSREYPSQGVLDTLHQIRPQEDDSLDMLRAKFFILLNEDEDMRKFVANPSGESTKKKNKDIGFITPLCPEKAIYFYDELNHHVLPSFAQDQTIPLHTFIDMIREVYLHS